MVIRNGTVIEPGKGERIADVFIDDETGIVTDVPCGGEVIDATGMYVTPGFIDTHIHGSFGADTSDGSLEKIITMCERLPEFGVAAFCPTTMTESESVIDSALHAVSEARKLPGRGGALILGVHLEGPFMSPEMAGVQDAASCISPADAAPVIDRFESRYPGLIRIIDVAPELEGGIDLIRLMADRYVMSLAHTSAGYDKAIEAFDAGATSVTHILNAMNAMGKRSPGVPGAVFDRNDVFVEMICDGIHIAPPIIRMMFKMIPEDRMIVVSDAMRGAGMPDGIYKLAEADVEVRGGRTYYGPEGGLAGSVTNLAQEAARLYSYGIDRETIIKAMTVNPLRRLGIDPCETGLGTLMPGKARSVNILDDELHLVVSAVDGVLRQAFRE